MNSLETDNYTVMSKSYYSKNLSYNSRLNTEHRILSFLNETVAKENTKKVYALHCYCVNLHFNEKNQTWLYKETLLKELTEMSVALL